MPKHNLTPTYAKIRIPLTSPAAVYTQQKITKIRLKDEIKFLYRKKQNLNKQLYDTHPVLANEWGESWHPVEESVNISLNIEMQGKYTRIDNKLQKLRTAQIPNTSTATTSINF